MRGLGGFYIWITVKNDSFVLMLLGNVHVDASCAMTNMQIKRKIIVDFTYSSDLAFKFGCINHIPTNDTHRTQQ